MKELVYVCMSGGVDSTAAALLLLRRGYAVRGISYRLLDPEEYPGAEEALSEARRAAETLGISHEILDLRREFCAGVQEPFAASYARGRTPNPCVDCNRAVKFGAALEWALRQGAAYIATGHYARVERAGAEYRLLRGTDPGRDQSYFLYQLTQRQLPHVLFPAGGYEKSVLRNLAEEAGLSNARRRDSQDICFLPEGDYVSWLRRRGVPARPGEFRDPEGRVLGRHRGQDCYTIGQRKGLGVSAPQPLYVARKLPEEGVVVLAPDSALYAESLTAQRVTWVSGHAPDPALPLTAKIRHGRRESPAAVEQIGEDLIRVRFEEPQRAIAPGQAVVFYREEQVLGGAVIIGPEA